MHKQPLLAIATLIATCMVTYGGLALFIALLSINWSGSSYALQFADNFLRILGFGEGGYGQLFAVASLGSGLVMLLLVSLKAEWTARHPILAGVAAALGACLAVTILISGLSFSSIPTFLFGIYIAFMLGPGLVVALVAGFGMRLIIKLDGLPQALGLGKFGTKISPQIVTEDELTEDANIDRQLGTQ